MRDGLLSFLESGQGYIDNWNNRVTFSVNYFRYCLRTYFLYWYWIGNINDPSFGPLCKQQRLTTEGISLPRIYCLLALEPGKDEISPLLTQGMGKDFRNTSHPRGSLNGSFY